MLVPLVAGCATTAKTSSAADRTDMAGMAGMKSATNLSSYWGSVAGTSTTTAGVTRRYFIRADEVAWNYAPTGSNQITGQPFGDQENTYVQTGPGRIGSTYTKCLYRQYTDATFNTLTARSAADAYLGFLGPVIRAEVGDTINVNYRNACRIPTSMHPHGVFYDKASEGAPYNDGTAGVSKTDDAVPTGGQHTYIWNVPLRAGPGPGDGSSAMWMYHSHTDEIGDTYAGLMGPMVITAAGMARADGSPSDVDQEVFSLYTVENENNSPYLQANIDKYAQAPAPDPADEDFQESNLMHSINGYVFGNQPMLTLTKGQHVRWYTMGMGTEVDLHTPHWHGNVVTANGMRTDVISLLPATMVTADMVPDNSGIWLFHCHVNDHISAGMMTRYKVVG
jgi:FtsP/CotA-like multicopper oxidase with cupredoxin domain